VISIYPLLGNGCVFYAVVRHKAIYNEKTTIIDSSNRSSVRVQLSVDSL
jgi:hypothetical protein